MIRHKTLDNFMYFLKFIEYLFEYISIQFPPTPLSTVKRGGFETQEKGKIADVHNNNEKDRFI